MSKLGTMLALAACLGATLIAGLTLTSSARISQGSAPRAKGALDPNAMMSTAPHALPTVHAPMY